MTVGPCGGRHRHTCQERLIKSLRVSSIAHVDPSYCYLKFMELFSFIQGVPGPRGQKGERGPSGPQVRLFFVLKLCTDSPKKIHGKVY